jgi:hypothetical protein
MVLQAGGIWLTVQVPVCAAWMMGALLQGIGTAMVYPTTLAQITTWHTLSWRARVWNRLSHLFGGFIILSMCCSDVEAS